MDWTSVRDRPPPKNEPVQVYDDGMNGGYIFGCFMHNGYEWQEHHWREGWWKTSRTISHWMPLPEPPQEDE